MEHADLKNKVSELMAKNRRRAGDFQYTVPSPTSYPYQWLWDSCFHAIILTHLNIEDAKQELLSLVSRQFENGMLPHMIYWDRENSSQEARQLLEIKWGREGTSSITQPPMIAYAAWRIYQRDSDIAFLEALYPKLFHFYQYLLHERDPHERHLVGIINPDESGEDNSPRFDSVLDLPPVHDSQENYHRRLKLVAENQKCNFDAPFCMKNFFWVKDVPFNAVMVENLRCLARIAEKTNRSYDAEYFDQEAARVTASMRELMLEDGMFWPTYGEHYQKIKTKTWAIFAPLFAKIPTQEEAELLVKTHLQNEREFRTPYLVPTVSIDESSFDPKGFWRGPVWLAVNWFLYHGLVNYGFSKLADEIRTCSLDLVSRSGFREQYDPYTGEGLGARDFTWGGLVLDMPELSKEEKPHELRLLKEET